MSYIITRRSDALPEPAAYTELRRAPHLAAARRLGHEIAYRFFEAARVLDQPIAHKTIGDILAWDGRKPIIVNCAGTRFTLAAS